MEVGIALSGGGTRGMVHVGALQALEEAGICPRIISGTSAGSVVGALYACGYTPAEISEIAQNRSLFRLFSLRIPGKGLIRHAFLRKQLEKYIEKNDFSVLQKPLYVVVSNLNSGLPEVWDSGPLIDLVIASSSVPILFEPIEIEGQMYVDGGLMKNLPASPLVSKCDIIIGVNLVPQLPVPKSEVRNMIGIATRCFNLSVLNNIKPELEHCDIVIEPPAIRQYSRFNISQIEEMYQIGYEETKKQLPEIQALLSGSVIGRSD